MWIYVQRTGDFFAGSTYVETGYSGRVPDGKIDPSKECVRDMGQGVLHDRRGRWISNGGQSPACRR